MFVKGYIMILSSFNRFFLFLCITLGTQVFANNMVNIYIISDKNFVGDRNNLLGVANQTKEYFKKHHYMVNIYEHASADLSAVKHSIAISKNKSIILSCAYYGIDAIAYLKADQKVAHNAIAVHLSHQILNSPNAKHEQMVQKNGYSGADLIVLPSHVLDEVSIKNLTSEYTKLLQTIGVAHNTYLSDLEIAYNRDKAMLPKAKKYLGVILAGDAPDSNGEMHYYTTEDAYKLAEHVSKLAIKEKYTVLVGNGPRTGKFDPNTGREANVHKDGIVDPVTQRFVEILRDKQVDFKLFDFQKGQPSRKELMFGAILKNPGSKILVPGESTSMISESIDLLPKGSIIIYQNSAMNESHNKHTKAEFDNGRASCMDLNMNVAHPIVTASVTRSAAELSAEAIYQLVQERFGKTK